MKYEASSVSQNKRLHAHLVQHGHITPLEAWADLGIYRLSARICELKKIGVPIRTARTNVRNRFGETCSVADYRYEPRDLNKIISQYYFSSSQAIADL